MGKSIQEQIAEFDDQFSKALDTDNKRYASMPRQYDVDAGEYIEDIDPEEADDHLKD